MLSLSPFEYVSDINLGLSGYARNAKRKMQNAKLGSGGGDRRKMQKANTLRG